MRMALGAIGVALLTCGLGWLVVSSGAWQTVTGLSGGLAPSASQRAASSGLAAAGRSLEEALGGAESPAAKPAAPKTQSQPQQSSGQAVAALDRLPVKPMQNPSGYDRLKDFGAAWADVDHNGCDTRNDILKRDMTSVGFKPGTHDCVVMRGTLNDPYTGRIIRFRRGAKTSSLVQIDHVVALKDAWATGAQELTAAQRERLANDPLNLLAVDGQSNQEKSWSDASQWQPSNRSFRCAYAARQIADRKSVV